MKKIICAISFWSSVSFGQWSVTVLADSESVHDFFLRGGKWPVVVGSRNFYRYDGISWASKSLPDSFVSFGDFALDGLGRLHYAQIGSGGTEILEYVENSTGWDIYAYHDGGFISCTEGYPSVAMETSLSGDTSYFAYAYDQGWVNIFCLIREGSDFRKDTVLINTDLFSPDIKLDSAGNPWIICHENRIPAPTRTFCAHHSGAWTWDTVEVTNNTFFFTSGPFLAVRNGTAYALYKPTGILKGNDDTLRFAWRRLDDTWHSEKIGEFQIRGLCFTPDGRIHGLAAFYDSVAYHVARDTANPDWDTLEVVDSVNGISPPQEATNWNGGYMLVDADGYLHAAYTSKRGELCYAKGGLSAGESSGRSRLNLILIPAPQGFYISGYSGPAQVYDHAGRLILSEEIKGKTLISPLRPGVYLVLAGRQRGRVAVR